jgi:thiol-disulfide isomerase/thioredoxin
MRWTVPPLARRAFDVLVWLLLLGFAAYRLGPQVVAAAHAGRGVERMPPLSLAALDGAPLNAEQLAGKVVLVNFWATWCPPCRFEMPGFERVYQDKKDQGFVIVGLATDRGGADEVRRFLAERGITYPVAMATGQVERDFGWANALPTSFLIGRDGTIRHEVKGIFAEPALRLAVDRLLAEPLSEGGAS